VSLGRAAVDHQVHSWASLGLLVEGEKKVNVETNLISPSPQALLEF
jgi:hypothetical protein